MTTAPTYEPNQAEANLCRRVQSLIREKRNGRRSSTIVITMSILVTPDGAALLIPDGAGVAEQIGTIDR